MTSNSNNHIIANEIAIYSNYIFQMLFLSTIEVAVVFNI